MHKGFSPRHRQHLGGSGAQEILEVTKGKNKYKSKPGRGLKSLPTASHPSSTPSLITTPPPVQPSTVKMKFAIAAWALWVSTVGHPLTMFTSFYSL